MIGSIFFDGSCVRAEGAQVGLKTNLVWDATATPNLGLEVGLSPKTTLQLAYGFNNWSWFRDDKKMKHWLLVPEFRYWFCQRFVGHFIGVQALGGEFNAGAYQLPLYRWDDLANNRLEGWMVGGGLMYGYHLPLSRHWNMETALGLGYIYFDYDEYPCTECGTIQGHGHWHYVGLTKLSLSFIYLFGK